MASVYLMIPSSPWRGIGGFNKSLAGGGWMGHGSASTAGGGGRSPGNPSFPPEYLHQNVYPDLSSDESKYKADTRQHWSLYISNSCRVLWYDHRTSTELLETKVTGLLSHGGAKDRQDALGCMMSWTRGDPVRAGERSLLSNNTKADQSG